MSDLQELLVTLDSVNQDADRNASDLAAQAGRLTKVTAVISAMVARGTPASGATTTASALHRAERAVTLAAQQLHQAAVAGRGFIERHAGPNSADATSVPNAGSLGHNHQPVVPYGDPYPTHGTSRSVHSTDITPQVAALSNLNEPYGRDVNDGHVLTHDEYDARYTETDGQSRYPANGGAVEGTLVIYENVDDFIRDHGNLVDRIGRPDGSYLGVPIEGEIASFDQRSLPTTSLRQPYDTYQLTGKWIDGWRLEVSIVSPGFGRSGGGIQMQIFDQSDTEVPIHVAMNKGVLR